MDNLQSLLVHRRKELKLSLRSAAKLIGMSHSYLASLEKGVDVRSGAPINVTPETLQLISKGYGFSYPFLMELAGYIKQPEKSSSEFSEIDMEKEVERPRIEFYENPEKFTLSGKPLSQDAMECILENLKCGIRVAKKFQ
jgi:transcriptional regulator with XRE-family HTH domain